MRRGDVVSCGSRRLWHVNTRRNRADGRPSRRPRFFGLRRAIDQPIWLSSGPRIRQTRVPSADNPDCRGGSACVSESVRRSFRKRKTLYLVSGQGCSRSSARNPETKLISTASTSSIPRYMPCRRGSNRESDLCATGVGLIGTYCMMDHSLSPPTISSCSRR